MYNRMESTELQRADIRGLDLRGADLRGADLRDTDLTDAMFDGARGGIAALLAQRDAVIRDLREQLADLVDERIDDLETKLAEAIDERDTATSDAKAAQDAARAAQRALDRVIDAVRTEGDRVYVGDALVARTAEAASLAERIRTAIITAAERGAS